MTTYFTALAIWFVPAALGVLSLKFVQPKEADEPAPVA